LSEDLLDGWMVFPRRDLIFFLRKKPSNFRFAKVLINKKTAHSKKLPPAHHPLPLFMDKLISVIIPTLNEAANIGRTLDHVLRHGGNRVGEVLVVDGGSDDATVAVAQQAGAKIIHSATGRARQMNAGAAAAAHPILYFVHADTLPPADFAMAIGEALAAGQPMGCFRYRFDSQRVMLRFNEWWTQFDWMFCQGGDKTFFIKKDVFDALGGYDERWSIMEEYDFLRRARAAGYPLAVLPQAALVSARKYEGRSWLRVQLANVTVFKLWQWRLADAATLRSIYQRMLG
jgi:rSAM/selenodomain-associated transferase 2